MTASPLEIAWSAIAAIGLGITAWMLIDGWLDFRAVGQAILGGFARRRGARWWLAVGAVTGNAITLFVWAGFLFVGLIAMNTPPPPPPQEQSIAAGWTLIAMEALLAGTQIWARFVRQRVAGRRHSPRRTTA